MERLTVVPPIIVVMGRDVGSIVVGVAMVLSLSLSWSWVWAWV